VGAAAALVIVALMGWRLLLWAGQPEPGEPIDPSPLTYRRDVVRSLADDAPRAAPPLPEEAEAETSTATSKPAGPGPAPSEPAAPPAAAPN
jgi:hypothetical protein